MIPKSNADLAEKLLLGKGKCRVCLYSLMEEGELVCYNRAESTVAITEENGCALFKVDDGSRGTHEERERQEGKSCANCEYIYHDCGHLACEYGYKVYMNGVYDGLCNKWVKRGTVIRGYDEEDKEPPFEPMTTRDIVREMFKLLKGKL